MYITLVSLSVCQFAPSVSLSVCPYSSHVAEKCRFSFVTTDDVGVGGVSNVVGFLMLQRYKQI